MSLIQIANLLQLHRTYISRLIEQNLISAKKVGRSYKVTNSALEKFLKGPIQKLYTVEQVAKIINIHPINLRKLIQQKKIPALKIGI